MIKPFSVVENANPGRSVFDLSYRKIFTCDMGLLVPVMCEEVVPGDHWRIDNEIVIRFMPLVAPILHPINVYVHYFFVPYRLLWDSWESFITGGKLGDDASVLPRWSTWASGGTAVGTLWDYLGFPIDAESWSVWVADDAPMDFPRRAYAEIWNQFYRDETLQTEIPYKSSPTSGNFLKYRNWKKDYFTSALLWQQRGTTPALPVVLTGNSPVTFSTSGDPVTAIYSGTGGGIFSPAITLAGAPASTSVADTAVVDGADFTTSSFDVADLRLAFQIQRFLERNARSGVRYTEFLHAHFGVNPRDDRLQRPEYIGGSFAPVVISEVLQTSETATTPQGTMAGHGISVSLQYCGKHFASEYGLIMGLMSVMPEAVYQQGINRQWLRRSRYDFYFPEFAHLSEQGIEREEIYAADDANNQVVWGYQPRYEEMRYKPSMVCSLMRDLPAPATDLSFWNLARSFASAPALDDAFVTCIPDKARIFAAPSEPGLLVNFGNRLKVVRPIPGVGTPGLIDHG